MDYKQHGWEYEDFGNFNYGMVGSAAGIPVDVLLRGAGYAQHAAGTSKQKWGTPYDMNSDSSYGDDPGDQE